MATLSQDLRERIVAAYDRGEGTRQEIADRYDVSLAMVKKLLYQRNKTGDIGNRHRFSGPKPKIGAAHRKRLQRLVREQPDLTLEELRDAIAVECTPQAVFYVLEDMGLTLKKRRSCPPN
jgi:transposase